VKRNVYRREIGATGSETAGTGQIDLRKVAWAAAVETMQVNLVAQGWVGLFGAMLDPSTNDLVWRGKGPGGEAEIKRAYSALMGRFFGRAVLRSDHRIKWLRQASEGLEVEPGVHLVRKRGKKYKGDLPDWVGWDRDRKMWAVCEAKGSHGSARWLSGEPEPVATAMKQIKRVEFRDTGGAIASEGWVVASRWGTVDNGHAPVIMTVDPLNEGRRLSTAEAARAEAELRVNWYADLLAAVGQERVSERLRGGASATAEDDRGLASVGDIVGYAALAIDGAGLFPMTGDERDELRRSLLRFAQDRGRKTALIVIDRDSVEIARSRQIGDGQATLKFDESPIPSTDGEVEAGRPDGGEAPAITQDGVTLSWDPNELDLKSV
jgi:hypothetical protein